MNLMRIGNRIYNFDRLIEAEFTESASVELLFAVAQSEARTNYNGDVIGEQFDLYRRTLRGNEAEEAWAVLNAMQSR